MSQRDTGKAERDAETARKVREWKELTDSGMRLRCGELSAQELRSIRAVLESILPAEGARSTVLDEDQPA